MTSITEEKFIAIRRIERTIFPSYIMLALTNINVAKYNPDLEILGDFCKEERSKHNNPENIKIRTEKIITDSLRLFYDEKSIWWMAFVRRTGIGYKPLRERFNTRHLFLIILTLFQDLQEDFSIGDLPDEVTKSMQKFFDIYTKNEKDWNNGNFLKSIYKKGGKLLKFLNERELFMYNEAKFIDE